MRITKLDIACTDPKTTANCYSLLMQKNVKEIGNACFEIELEGSALFFCSKEMSGAPEHATGVHQLHIKTEQSYDDIVNIADTNQLKYEMVQYGPQPSLCVWDNENNPIIFSN